MSAPASGDEPALSVGAFRRIEEACSRFEELWRSGAKPRIEDYLAACDGAERAELLRELLRLELELRLDAGERPEAAAYERRFNDQRAVVEALTALNIRSPGVAVPPVTPVSADFPTPPPSPQRVPDSKRGWRGAGYDIVRELGRGGMGVVYEARQVRLNRTVALKTVLAGPASSSRQLVRFLAEGETIARLRHPNIVQIHEVGHHEGRPFIALEYVDGGTLAESLAGKPQPARVAAALVEQLARAVHHAHQQGVVHRDLKPANVLLAAGGLAPDGKPLAAIPKITDFGLSRRVQLEAGLTGTGEVLGTPAYMAPEQASGQARRAGPAADVYALGAILYECLTGRPPFSASRPAELLLKVINEEPPPLTAGKVKVPRDLEAVCLRCLRKDPKARYASAEALADDLHRFLEGRPVAARPVGASESLGRWVRRHPAATLLVAVLVLMTAAAFGLVLEQWRLAVEERHAVESRVGETDAARKEGEEARRRDGQREARLALELGAAWCDGGDVPRGLVWLARAAERAHAAGAADVERLARVSLAEWQTTDRAAGAPLKHDAPVYAAVFLGDGGFRTVSAKGLHLWDAAGGTRGVKVLEGAAGPLRCAAFSPDGKSLAASTESRTGLWDVAGTPRGPFLPGTGGVAGVVFHPTQGKSLVTIPSEAAHATDGLRRWDLAEDGPHLRLWEQHPPLPLCAALTRGDLILVGSDDHGAGLYDAASGRLSGKRVVHAAAVTAVAVSPDGRTAATGSGDGRVRLWHVDSHEPLVPPLSLREGVTSLAFSPDNSILLSGGANGAARFWDVRTGTALGPPFRLGKEVLFVAFSPDGRRALTGTRDGVVQPWQAPKPPTEEKVTDLVERVRRLTGLEVGENGALRIVGG